MNFFRISELPMHGAGDFTDYAGGWDDNQVLSPTAVKFTPASGTYSGQEKVFLYYRGIDELLSTTGVASIGVMTADVATWTGRNWNKERTINPIIVPGEATTDADLIAGDYNDMVAVEYDGEILLFVNIYDAPTGNRMVLFSSADGLTFTFQQEIEYSGGYFGATCGPMWNVGGTLWGLFSGWDATVEGYDKILRKSLDGGLTWTDYGTAIYLNPTAGTFDSQSLICGRGIPYTTGDTHIYALIPGMPNIGDDGGGDPYNDWPEAFGLWRIAVADLGQTDFEWDRYDRNPVMLRSATDGGIWHLNPVDLGGSQLAVYEAWAMPGFENINSTNMNTLRTTPYAGLSSGWSTSHFYTARMGSKLALTDWAADPFPAGSYALRNVATGNYLAIDGTSVVMTETGAVAALTLARQLDFYTLTNAGLCLRVPDRAVNSAVLMEADPGAITNQKGQWALEIWEDAPDDLPQVCAITNRYSSLSLAVRLGADQNGAVIEQRPFIGDPAMLWEVVGIVAAGTAVDTTDVSGVVLRYLIIPTRAQAVTKNTAGAFAGVSDGQLALFGGLVYRRLAASTVISDMPGWVPHGDLTILQFASEAVLAADAQPAINAMLAYAATLVEDTGLTLSRNGFSGKVKASLANRSWLVSSRVDMSQCAGVELCDGTLEANTATWPSPSTYVLRFGGINNDNNRYMGLRNVVVRCNRVANGILAENLQNSFADDVFIHGQTQYGWRKIGPKAGGCRMRNIRANEWFTSEAGYDEKANRTSIGISNECADETYENCEGVLCLINISLSGTGAHVFRQSHPFHGVMADLSTYTITGAVSDGATGTRCTVAATTGLSNGDLVVMPWINGISGEGGRPGSYVISNVTGTTFDVAAYVFAGSFTGDDTPNVTLWSEERVNLLINSDVSVADIDIEADNGKIKIVQDAAGSPRVKLRVLAAGLSANNARCAVELVADGVEADFAGVQVDIHTEGSGYRLTAINGGTFADPIAAMVNEFRTDRASRSTALMSVGHGTEAKPSLRFSGLDGGGAISTDANTGFFAHSDHTPALTVDGEEKLHFHASMLLPENGYVIANTATIAQLITYAAAGDFDDLADNSVVWAGGCPFAKQAGAAVYSLPVGFVPADRITAAHWGITRATTADVTAKLQAMIDYAEVVAIGLRDRVPVYGTGAEMTVTAPLYNALGSLAFMDWKLIAAAGSWGTLTYATVPILGDEHPVATAMMMIGGRYAAVPVTQNISPEFGPGFSLDGNRLAMGGLAVSGVTEPVGERHIEGCLVYHMFLGKVVSCKWQQTLYINAASVSSDENTPCFRTGRGLWSAFGDNQLGSIHSSYCRENFYITSSPFFITYGHVFGGWKGNGPDWRVWSVGTTTITVDGSGKVLTFPVTTGGAGYAVGDTLYIEKWAGDTLLDYAANRHHNPDNWPGLCCVVVTSVDGSGGITGLRVVKDRWNTEGRGLGYTAGTYNLYHVQKISPINIKLVENGALTISTLYLDKAIAIMDGTYKLRVQTCHFVADDELSLVNMLVFKARTGKDLLTNFEMHDVHYNFTKAYGSYDPRNIIYIDETEVPFASASPVIGMALPNQASQVFNVFPTTIGRTERIFASEAFSGVAGGYYVDWDLGDAGFAGQLYRLPGTKTLRFSSVKNPSKTFVYRYLADNPLVAPAITGTNARRHTVRIYVDDATRDGGDVIRAEWSGIVRGTKDDGTATIAGPAYISLPNPDKTPIDLSALWTGANSGVLGEGWSSRSGLYTDLAATTPCTTDGQLIKAWVGKRGILTALATPGEELLYRIDANGVPYVQQDGGLRRLITANYDMSSVSVISIFAAAINMQDAASATIFNNNGVLAKSWRLNVPSNTTGGVGLTADGGAAVSVSDNTIALKPQRLAITATANLAAGTETLNVNGRTQKTASGSFGGATVWNNKPISIGARATGSASLPTVNIYEVAFFGKIYTDAELLVARKLLADAAGVVL